MTIICTAEYIYDEVNDAELWLRFNDSAKPDIGLSRIQAQALSVWLAATLSMRHVIPLGHPIPVTTLELDGVVEAQAPDADPA